MIRILIRTQNKRAQMQQYRDMDSKYSDKKRLEFIEIKLAAAVEKETDDFQGREAQ
ncbi:MAG: hypothetical protein JSR97_00380 [Verrucomicrobia bacterium]|nr:hypothetical protein [Verrucomicrobiota bacterium]